MMSENNKRLLQRGFEKIQWDWRRLSRPSRRRIWAWWEQHQLPPSPPAPHCFHVVSSERNAGEFVIKCLNSVYSQDYDRSKIQHVVIDDDSTDGTDQLIREWMLEHPDHAVELIHTTTRRGGCANNLDGFRMANPGDIIIELNGDDWLPDPGVFSFMNRVFADPEVWMTYNTTCFPDGRMRINSWPIPSEVIRNNRFRQLLGWPCSCVHAFRAELFSQLPETRMIDPESGEYWANADDMAFYYSMLELSGKHSQHCFRFTYVQNVRDYSERNVDGAGQKSRGQRISAQQPLQPLSVLIVGDHQPLGLTKDIFERNPDWYAHSTQ